MRGRLVRTAALLVFTCVFTCVVGVANLYVVLVIGARCGDDGPDPSGGSALKGYCDFFEDPDDRVTFLIGILGYAPVLLAILGGVVATARRSAGAAWITVAVCITWLAALLLPALLLPS